MTEDEFGDHDLVFGMNADGNALTIVVYGDLGRRQRHDDLCDALSLVCRSSLASNVVQRVHDELVKDFEQARIECELTPRHLFTVRVEDPSALTMRITRADVSVRKLENVLPLGKLLVALGNGFSGRRGHRTG